MCTVTFLPQQRGYRLGMNRDESRQRVKGRPPARHRAGHRSFLAPSEPSGGTWIAVNDAGIGLALINWYAVNRQPAPRRISRGRIILSQITGSDPDSISSTLGTMSLGRMSPFRLIGFFPATRTVFEWRWNLHRLVRKRHPWQAQQWISSGFDEPNAQRIRSRTFAKARQQKTFGTATWLRRLHGSHQPEPGPFATCMHRDDAMTVSYTEVTVLGKKIAMRHHPGPPCELLDAPHTLAELTLASETARPAHAP